MTEYKCEEVTPYVSSESKKEQITKMFDRIAGAYDPMNHLMSLGQDRSWRKKAIERIAEFNPKRILDVATGTGDFAIVAPESNLLLFYPSGKGLPGQVRLYSGHGSTCRR